MRDRGQDSATRGFKARENMTVATMFELSLKPFRKSKMTARAIIAINIAGILFSIM